MSLSLGGKHAPSRQIIEHLQRNGSATIKELEAVLGVTTTAVRQQITALLEDGYIQRNAVVDGVGRPRHTYSITERTRELYACHCDDLALTLLQEVFALEGEGRARLLLDRVGDRLAQRYAGSVRGNGIGIRVAEMAQALEARGVLTEIEPQPVWEQEGSEVIVLKTYNCPYHELAQEHREICEMDEKMMGSVLGSRVELSSCIMDGHGSCTFRVSN